MTASDDVGRTADPGSAAVTVAGYGTSVPRARITASVIGEAWDGFRARGVEEKRVPAADEDAVTMAVAAARAALADADCEPATVATLAVGTTTPPIDEGDVGATVAEILGCSPTTEVDVHTQSTRAGVRALVTGLRAARPALVVAADCPLGSPGDAIDHAAGAGAVAFVLVDAQSDDEATGDAGSPRLVDRASYTREFAGTRFRRRGRETVEGYGATAYERTAFASVVAGAVDALAERPAAVAPTATDGSLPGRVSRAVDADVTVHHMAATLGDTGAASPLFGLLEAWDSGATSVAVVGFGDGASADAVAVEGRLPVAFDWPATTIDYAGYLKRHGHLTGTESGGSD
jgi:hydroxymethylglutaryl-CoA synthase